MTIEKTLRRLNFLDRETPIQNMIAQANARYILFNTSESRENFPRYTIVDHDLNLLAFSYLNYGSYLAENQQYLEAVEPLEKGASLLEYTHGAPSNRSKESNYYGLISALAYYAAFQYSKAFILINKFEPNTIIAKLISLFLKRDFILLSEEISRVIVDEASTDDLLSGVDEDKEGNIRIQQISIARALNAFVHYFQTGDRELLTYARNILSNLKEIAEIEQDPGIWWVIRLLMLIEDGFSRASLWDTLSPYFDLKSNEVDSYIRSLVFQEPRGIYELFSTQRKALAKVLNEEQIGSVISIPTSSGKTRIAELAILNCISKNQRGKVLYIAPFRSLAFEIENALENHLGQASFTVSHLYGGSLFSKLDEQIIDESQIIIATPEKAKALLRGSNDIINQIKLIVIDEGHLLGSNKRLIGVEIFYEELRFFLARNEGRFLLLSAVLPNPEDLAQWLTSSPDNTVKDNWRPSDERMGLLEWTGVAVNLKWISNDKERSSFNPNFVVRELQPKKPRQRIQRYLPGDKNSAVAATAFKLRTFGPVLIFVGIKASVFVMARCYYACLGVDPSDFQWINKNDWKAYELACIETYGEKENDWLYFARKGILCHNGDLHADVRLALERLMRNDKPLVIIATSTLGQGVNLGVSSVIFATVQQGNQQITKRDFWNIAGRAGRAFVDHEGKILVALDAENLHERGSFLFKQQNRSIEYNRKRLSEYFDKAGMDVAFSGVLGALKKIKDIASENKIDFGLLLQLISENKIDELAQQKDAIEAEFELIDDTLLSLLYNNNPGEGTIDYGWMESFFRQSLAYIQSRNDTEIRQEEVLSLFKSRTEGIIVKVGTDRGKWRSIIKSGIPLNSDLQIEEMLPDILLLLDTFKVSGKTTDDKIELIKATGKLVAKIPILSEFQSLLSGEYSDKILSMWVNGGLIHQIFLLENGEELVEKVFTFMMPWIFNGIAKKIRILELDEYASWIEEVSLLLEAGLPELKAIKIYQAGIRSRSAAIELSRLFDDDIWNKTSRQYRQDIIENAEGYKLLVSITCEEWIDLLSHARSKRTKIIPAIPKFSYPIDNKIIVIYPRRINGEQYMISSDFSFCEKFDNSKLDFSRVNNLGGVYFRRIPGGDTWEMIVENPYIESRKIN